MFALSFFVSPSLYLWLFFSFSLFLYLPLLLWPVCVTISRLLRRRCGCSLCCGNYKFSGTKLTVLRISCFRPPHLLELHKSFNLHGLVGCAICSWTPLRNLEAISDASSHVDFLWQHFDLRCYGDLCVRHAVWEHRKAYVLCSLESWTPNKTWDAQLLQVVVYMKCVALSALKFSLIMRVALCKTIWQVI